MSSNNDDGFEDFDDFNFGDGSDDFDFGDGFDNDMPILDDNIGMSQQNIQQSYQQGNPQGYNQGNPQNIQQTYQQGSPRQGNPQNIQQAYQQENPRQGNPQNIQQTYQQGNSQGNPRQGNPQNIQQTIQQNTQQTYPQGNPQTYQQGNPQTYQQGNSQGNLRQGNFQGYNQSNQRQTTNPNRGYPQQTQPRQSVPEYRPTSNRDRSRVHNRQSIRPDTTDFVPNDALIPDNMQVQSQPPRRKSKLKFVVIPVLLILGVCVGIRYINTHKNNNVEPPKVKYETTAKYAYDTLLNALNEYDAEALDNAVGIESGDSYLAQEWSYANSNPIREDFIKNVCKNVNFAYTKNVVTDESGQPIPNESNSDSSVGGKVTVTCIDYSNLITTMQNDKDTIVLLYENSGISEKDYDFSEQMTDLMLGYINSQESLPTATADITFATTSDDKSNPPSRLYSSFS